MPGFILHQGATVLCAHAGQAQPMLVNPRVTVSGMPTIPLTSPHVVAGCALPPPPAANGPCITAQYLVGSVRVTSLGQPFVLIDGQSICAPTGTPLLPAVASQVRVTAM
jgi:hypothetical protein